MQKLLASDGIAGDYFGYSVSISGDTAFIGAVCDDDSKGSVYVFTCSGGTWTLQQKLLASDGTAGDEFGIAVSLSGDTALIGAVKDDDNGHYSGSAYIFACNENTWTQQAKLLPSDGTAEDWFGYSVSLSGDTALIGAVYDDGSKGSAYVFTRTGGIWTQQQKLLASDGVIGEDFGYRVSLDDNTALISAVWDSDNGQYSGSAYVFTRNGTTWTEQQKLLASDGATWDQFGYSVSLDGDTALIGAPKYQSNGDGSAYVFIRTGTTWAQQAELLASNGVTGDTFGFSVSLDCDTALIGAVRAANGNGDGSGSAYIFTRISTTWTQQTELLASDGVTGDYFGVSVSISGDTAFIGAYSDDSYKGSAYVFTKEGANQPPIANFTYIPSGPITNDLIQFTDKSTDSDGNIISWSWDFGDGDTSPIQNPTHQYDTAGIYNVSVTVTDDDAASDSIEKTIIVAQAGPRTIYVDDDNTQGPWDGTSEHPFQHIQDGFNVANPGETVFVYSGIYYESVSINKDNIRLIGEDKNTTIIDSCGSYSCIYIQPNSNYNFISNFTIKNSTQQCIDILLEWGGNCNYNTISNCILRDCDGSTGSGAGIRFGPGRGGAQVNYNTIIDCEISNTVRGVLIENADPGTSACYNQIINCRIHNNGVGIQIGSYIEQYGALHSNLVCGCTIFDNLNYGINIQDGNNNLLYHNNIINNAQNSFDGRSNTWYNTELQEGNFWSDYTGSDNNGDGIGDTPYDIPGGSNQDLYPLMLPWNGSLPPAPTPTMVYVDDDFDSLTPGWGYDHFNHTQDGINAVAENGTVYVYDGIYYENIDVAKEGIHLIGENKNTTIIDGGGTEKVVLMLSNNVNLTGFTIKSGYAGIFVTNTISNLQLSNNIIKQVEDGVTFDDNNINVTISFNIIQQCGDGIRMSPTTNSFVIHHNLITANREIGIVLHGNNHRIIENTISQNSGVGLWLTYANGNTIYHNNIVNNSQNAYDECTNNWDNGYPSSGNYWSDYTGEDNNHDGIGDTPYNISGGSNQDLYPLMYPWEQGPPVPLADIYVDDDNIQGPWDGSLEHPYQHIQDGVNAANPGDTIYVYHGTYNENVVVIQKNNITLQGENKETTIINADGSYESFGSMYVETSHSITISGFTLHGYNAPSVYFRDSSDKIIFDCILCNSSYGAAIYTEYTSMNNTVKDCEIYNNSYGIGIGGAAYNYYLNQSKVFNCSIHNNGIGIIIKGREDWYGIINNTVITGCNIFNNTEKSIFINQLLGKILRTTIYHNNIINNANNAYDNGTNAWYNITLHEGNYWSDYTGVDNNHDGIGDTPYNISGGSNQDLYPFMQQNGWLLPLIVNFSYNPLNPTTQDIIQFTDTSYDIDGYLVNWSWDFGDGSVSYAQNPTHQYSDHTTYNVVLTVTDDDGATNSISKHLVVYDAPPFANFTYTPSSPINTSIIHFTDTSIGLDDTIVSWWWDFGDHYYSDLRNPVHCYYVDGTYNVSLRVTDDDGGNDTTWKTIIVDSINDPPYPPSDPDPPNQSTGIDLNPVISVTVTDPEGEPLTVSFYDASNNSLIGTITNAASGTRASLPWTGLDYSTTYHWYTRADDGTLVTQSPTWSFTTQQPPNHPPNPPAQPSGPLKGIAGEDYAYTTSATDPDGDLLKYGWDWNNDSYVDTWTTYIPSGTPKTVYNIWNDYGVYQIRVKAKDIHGLESDWSPPLQVRMFKLGDINGDDHVNFGDINPFVLTLTDGEVGYYNAYPNGYYYTADINQDGAVNFGDINPFVALLTRAK